MFKVEIKTDNAAFADDMAAYEVSRILELVAHRLEDGESSGRLYDCNGNDVGSFKLT